MKGNTGRVRPIGARAARALAGAAVLAAGWAAASDLDVPFIVTPDRVTHAMLELAGVGPRDHVIDLGSGDGRIVIEAARRHGATGLGVEIVPELVDQSRANARRAGVEGRARFVVQDLFDTDLAPATVVTMYLLPEVNLKLRPRLLALAPGTRIVSHDWDLGDWTPDRTLTVDAPDKPIGREKLSRLYLWTVPAPMAGRWCGDGGRVLELEQRHQHLAGTLAAGRERAALVGRVDAERAHALGAAGARIEWQWRRAGSGAPWMSVLRADAAWSGWAGVRLTPCS